MDLFYTSLTCLLVFVLKKVEEQVNSREFDNNVNEIQ